MDIREELVAKAKVVGVKIKKEQADKFQRYYELLVEWNERINLTAITEPEDVVIKHFVDSLLLLKAVEIKQNAKMIDVGTGAGFPAVPIKIMRPDIDMTLLDGLNKRLKFLNVVGEELDLKFTTVHKRAEEAGRMKDMRESYDYATARAVARMNTLCEYCIPLIKMKGKFIAMKGKNLADELVEAKKAISVLGCQLKAELDFVLPDEEQSERKIAVIQKLRFTPKEFPRHGNKISKDPII